MMLKAVLQVTDQSADPVDTHSLSCCPYRKTIRVKIVDEEEYERQENFFIALGEPKWMERGISGVRFFKKKNEQNKTTKRTKKFKQTEKQQQQKATIFFSPPFSSLFLPPFDQQTFFILFPPVFSLSPCFGIISAFLALAYFQVLLSHLLGSAAASSLPSQVTSALCSSYLMTTVPLHSPAQPTHIHNNL